MLQNNITSLRSGSQTSEKKAYERMSGEKAAWYQRFVVYCQMGRDRSIQAVWQQEREAEKSNGKDDLFQRSLGQRSIENADVLRLSVPGNWNKAATQYQWYERAQEYDAEQRRMWEERLQREVYNHAEFASRACRIWTLNTYAMFCQEIVLETFDSDKNVTMQDKLASIKLSQSLLKDIRKEMDALEKTRP